MKAFEMNTNANKLLFETSCSYRITENTIVFYYIAIIH